MADLKAHFRVDPRRITAIDVDARGEDYFAGKR